MSESAYYALMITSAIIGYVWGWLHGRDCK